MYYYLISGLPELKFDASVLPIDPVELKRNLYNELESDDYKQLEILLYPYDHNNLENKLLGKDSIENEGLTNFSLEQFGDLEDIDYLTEFAETNIPPYIKEIIPPYLNASEDIEYKRFRKELDNAYYSHVEKVGNRYVREYTRFEYDLSNLISVLKSSKNGIDPLASLTGDNSFASHLRQMKGNYKIKGADFEYFDEVIAIEKSSAYTQAELQYDRLRWRVIEQITLFDDFSIETVLGYFSKLLLVNRWVGMTDKKGERKFLEAVDKVLGNVLPSHE